MGDIYRVNSYNEALELAKSFQISGKYNLFRGQARDWEVIPSIGRVARKKYPIVTEKIIRFNTYFKTEESLKKYASCIDTIFTIAQHYGLPTNYIDFTSDVDVAFFFAMNSKKNRINEDCSIICLNDEDFRECVEMFRFVFERNNVHPPYIFKAEIDNLWRLDAQKGCCLFTPYVNIETFYDFDRILFPFNSSSTKLLEADIYPIHKSELELLLDLYFETERIINNQDRFKKIFNSSDIVFNWVELNNEPNYDLLKNKEIHSSWSSDEYTKWFFPLTESWSELSSVESIELTLPKTKENDQYKKNIQQEISKQFAHLKVQKSNPLSFVLLDEFIRSTNNLKKAAKMCSILWNGTRNLPLTINEIIDILASYLNEIIHEKKDNEKGKLITIEIQNLYGVTSKCQVNPINIVDAFRDDIDKIIIDDIPRPIPCELLLDIPVPQYIFDFSKLTNLFKTELIVSQALHSTEKEYPVIYFSPSQIKILGYA